MVKKLVPGPFLKNQNLTNLEINSLKCYKDCFYCMSKSSSTKNILNLRCYHLLLSYIKLSFKKKKWGYTAHSTCNLMYITPQEISVISHNGWNYYCHLFIRELAKEFEGELDCIGDYSDKYITFSVPVTKEVKWIAKRGKELKPKIISCKLKFIIILIDQNLLQLHHRILLIILRRNSCWCSTI